MPAFSSRATGKRNSTVRAGWAHRVSADMSVSGRLKFLYGTPFFSPVTLRNTDAISIRASAARTDP
ncbi:hypothetical protein SGPA1_31349 [Streptomyces misionensis JCM 4497]